MNIPVLRDRFARSWPMHPMGEAPEVINTSDAFTRIWPTDAHFAAYALPEGAPIRRLSSDAVAHCTPSMVLLVADVDAPEHASTEAWREETRQKAPHLPGTPFGYFTRGGCRFVWTLDPWPVTDGAEWSKVYLLAGVAIAATSGLIIDPKCCDWTRLYRLPHATRDGEVQAHGWVCGSPDSIGRWQQPEMTKGETVAAWGWLRGHGGHAWRSASMRFVERPQTPPRVLNADETGRALAFAVRAVENAGKGQRNAELFGRTKWLAGLVERGELDAGAVARTMLDAAKRAGLAEREARRTIASALGREVAA